jgi:hypothetical protein
MPPIVCSCCVARCLQKPRDFHEELEDHGQHDNCIAELIFFKLRARSVVDVGISDRQLEMGASSREVRTSMLMRAVMIDSAAPPPAHGHASEGPRQHLSLRDTFPERKVSRTPDPPAHVTPCSSVPCEVAGRFILTAQEDISRERRH